MTPRITRTLCAGLVACAGLTVVCGLRAQDDAEVAEQKDPKQRLRTLLQERHDTLVMRVRALETRREIGLVDQSSLLSAQIDALDAELHLMATKAERIEVLRKRVQLFRELERMAEHLRSAPVLPVSPGRRSVRGGSPDDFLLARAARMQAEIDLAREELASD